MQTFVGKVQIGGQTFEVTGTYEVSGQAISGWFERPAGFPHAAGACSNPLTLEFSDGRTVEIQCGVADAGPDESRVMFEADAPPK